MKPAHRGKPRRVLDLWQSASVALSDSGIDSPRLDARLLTARALGWSIEKLLTGMQEPAPEGAEETLARLVQRRIEREPVAYILGEQEFWSMDFQVTPDVLIPRPDSETVVEKALELMAETPPSRILDLGTGSGCLLLALLNEWPEAQGVGVDQSPQALDVMQENARRHGMTGRITALQSDWLEKVEGEFDLILSNPPYIPQDELASLQPEVAMYEPRTALDGGSDGLDAYRELAMQARRHLAPHGWMLLEIGAGQDTQVAELLSQHGWHMAHIAKDLAGIPRCIAAMLPR